MPGAKNEADEYQASASGHPTTWSRQVDLQKYDTTDDSSFPKRIRSTTLLTDEDLVCLSVEEMARQEMTRIHADHLPQYSMPNQIGDYIPDATALHKRRLVVLEAEPTDSLTSAHTSSQLKAFYSHASNSKGWLVLAVEKSDEKTANSLLTTLFGNAKNALV